MGKSARDIVQTIKKENDAKPASKDKKKKKIGVDIPTGKASWKLPTGILSLDRILGGGIPGGTIVQVYGPEGAGKTTLSYHISASALGAGLETVLIPLETYSAEHATSIGVDVNSDNWVVWRTDNGEDTLDVLSELLRNSDAKVFIVDSIGGLTPDDNAIGAKARLISRFLDKNNIVLRTREAILIVVNHLRIDMSGSSFMAYEKPIGGRALQYYTDLKIRMNKHDVDKVNARHISDVIVQKAKFDDVTPHGTTEFDVCHLTGIDKTKDLLRVCVESNILEKSGAWYNYGTELRWQGLSKVADYVLEHPEFEEELKVKYLAESIVSIEQNQDDEVDESDG